MISYEFLAAYLLDLIIGDPSWLPHPVRIIGRSITLTETIFRTIATKPITKRIAGIFIAVMIPLSTYLITWFMIRSFSQINHILGVIISIYLAYTTLAIRSLKTESYKVYQALISNNISEARRHLSYIVGRDTESLPEQEVVRATVETVAENTSDGIIAPLFYLLIGGPPLAMVYKAINTLDSMIGYKNERYIDLGWGSARLDDLANYLPARITGLLMVLASLFLGKDWKSAFRIMIRDGRKHDSPNSGIPEAAVAGGLRIRLGGVNKYFGKEKAKPFIGEPIIPLNREHIKDAVRLTYMTSFIMAALGLLWLW